MGVFDITDDERKKWDEELLAEGEDQEGDFDFWPNDKNWWRAGYWKAAEVPPDEDKRAVEEFLKRINLEDYVDFFESMSQLAHMKKEELKALEVPIKQRQAI